MHERFFRLAGITCPKCRSKILQSIVNGTNHTVTCPDCAVWATAGTHEEAVKLAIRNIVAEIDPNLRAAALANVTKSVVSTMVELPGGVSYDKLTGDPLSDEAS